jgi:hypothetical protein
MGCEAVPRGRPGGAERNRGSARAYVESGVDVVEVLTSADHQRFGRFRWAAETPFNIVYEARA